MKDLFSNIKNVFFKRSNDNSSVYSDNENEEYTSCRHLLGGITFMHQAFRVCCSNKNGLTFADNYKGEKIDWKEIQKIRQDVIENCKKGILPKNCNGCVELETKKWKNDKLINDIFINHWDNCNCACIYCVAREHQQFLQKKPKPSRYYEVYPHIKQLYKHKMISPNVHVEMVGGDLTVLDESDKIINLCIDNGVGEMSFHSSCIFYSKGIERALQEVKYVDMDFSIDCGNRELYKKIKRIDAFDDVVANVKRYMACSPNSVKALDAKYIIIDGYNDNLEAFEEWMSLINSLGIKRAKIDVNFRKYFPEYHAEDTTVPKVYYDIYERFSELIKKYGMEDCCWEFSKRVMKEGGIPVGYQ